MWLLWKLFNERLTSKQNECQNLFVLYKRTSYTYVIYIYACVCAATYECQLYTQINMNILVCILLRNEEEQHEKQQQNIETAHFFMLFHSYTLFLLKQIRILLLFHVIPNKMFVCFISNEIIDFYIRSERNTHNKLSSSLLLLDWIYKRFYFHLLPHKNCHRINWN